MATFTTVSGAGRQGRDFCISILYAFQQSISPTVLEAEALEGETEERMMIAQLSRHH
jgi:hypothetical protein